MQHVKIVVSIEIEVHNANNGFGQRMVIIPTNNIKFRFDYYLNDIQFLDQTWEAKFSGYSEEEMANQISNTMRQSSGNIWCPNGPGFRHDEPHTIEMIYSNEAKEIFDMISKYKPKFLSSTIPHV